MKVFHTLEPAIRRSLVVLFVAGLLFWASLASLLPTLSLYIRDVGASKQQIGVVMGAFAIGLLLFRPWLGRMADQRGRKIVLMIGLLVATIAPLGYLLTTSIPALISIRAFHGMSIAAFTTAYSALVVDLSPEANRGEVIGYMSLTNPIGMAVGPALGGYVLAWAGYGPLFLLAAGLGLVGLGCGWGVATPAISPATNSLKSSFRTDSHVEDEPPTLQLRSTSPGWRVVLSDRLRIPTLLLLMIGLAFGTLSTFVPLFIQETGANLNTGLFYTAAAIASFVVRLPTGRASDVYGRGRFITLGLVLYTVSMVLLWTATSAPAFLLAGVFEGAGAGMFIPTIVTLVADRAAADERGRVFGLCMGGFDLGIAIAGPTLGLLAESLGYRGLFGLASGLTLLALIVFIMQGSKDIPHSLRFALSNGRDVYALSAQPESPISRS